MLANLMEQTYFTQSISVDFWPDKCESERIVTNASVNVKIFQIVLKIESSNYTVQIWFAFKVNKLLCRAKCETIAQNLMWFSYSVNVFPREMEKFKKNTHINRRLARQPLRYHIADELSSSKISDRFNFSHQ